MSTTPLSHIDLSLSDKGIEGLPYRTIPTAYAQQNEELRTYLQDFGFNRIRIKGNEIWRIQGEGLVLLVIVDDHKPPELHELKPGEVRQQPELDLQNKHLTNDYDQIRARLQKLRKK